MRLTTLASLLLALPLAATAADHPPRGDRPGPPPGGDHQGPPPGGDQGGERRGPPIGNMLERAENFLAYADGKDGDKEVEERWAKWEEKFKADRPEEFKKMDTDGDGKISRAEARAAIEKMFAMLKEKAPDLFAKIDTNGDGKISREEAAAAREQFRKDHPPGDKPPGDKPPGGGEPGADPEQERRRRGEGK
jgi:hypothetical protein